MSEWWRDKDPLAEREAKCYENPIPSREFIIQVLNQNGAPATHSLLCSEMKVLEKDQQDALMFRLKAMVRDGQLLKNRKGAYTLLDKLDLIKGQIQGHRDGFGFLIPDDGSEDLYISAWEMRQVFDKDRVLIREIKSDRRGRREGCIVEVLERNTSQVVGVYHEESGAGYVVPENIRMNQEIIITPGSLVPTNGQYVLVELVEQPEKRRAAIGIIKEVLGDQSTPGLEVEVALYTYDIPHLWSDNVKEEIKKISIELSESDKKNRFDLRDLPFVTIDGEDSKDFDDAVYCRQVDEGGWQLYVAIADVSHYVKTGTALDEEAFNRGNSVYFPGQVIPMLPEVLSNGLCSLNPQIERLALVCEMEINHLGEIKNYFFYEGLINSHSRLTYNYVWEILERDNISRDSEKYFKNLFSLYDLFRVLKQRREERGAINFDMVETQIIFNSHRKVDSIISKKRNDAHKIIEECMLCANTASAEFMIKHGIPGVYRVHEGPSLEKRQGVDNFLKSVFLSLPKGEISPKDVQNLLDSVKGRADFQLIQLVILRAMSQAVYAPKNQGHFGLALNAYTHFTSPIRRYSDLVVHRIIHSIIHSNEKTQHVRRVFSEQSGEKIKFPYQLPKLDEITAHCSKTERRADEATRDATNRLKCEYMQQHLGEMFTGSISSVVGFGLFVMLDNLFVEGLAHISTLPGDYYKFDATLHRLTGEKTGRQYCIGDKVKIVVARVDLESKQIDFELNTSDLSQATDSKNLSEEVRRSRSIAAKNKVIRKAKEKQNMDASLLNKKNNGSKIGKKNNKSHKTSKASLENKKNVRKKNKHRKK